MFSSTQQQKPENSIFGNAFNLHPLDALAFLQLTHQHLKQFTYAFKERIQAEIQYSKSLIKVSKIIAKHINPSKPSPISYISSAFKVEHELRARHALQLAEYLHTEIEVPCQSLLQEGQYKLKQMTFDLKKQYKQGETVQQIYQKYLKKYYRSREDWQEKMISKTILPYIPGVSHSQIEKANIKLLEQKEQNAQLMSKYLTSLQTFNKFAQKFNQNISQIIFVIEKETKKQLSLESNCLRKLIVSEINMFKNIEYDMINISKQMQSVQPKDQLQIHLEDQASRFNNPILSIYSEGPIIENNLHSIDFKYPITRSFLEETLLKIQRQNFTWMMQNKHNSTFKYALGQAWKKFEGLQAEDFMQDLQDYVVKNKVIKQIPLANREKQFLNTEQAFSVSFSIITSLASFIRPLQLTASKQTQILQVLRGQFNLHHFYRFFAVVSLEQFLNLKQNVLNSAIQSERLVIIVKILLQESVAAKDIFVVRLILALMFATQIGQNRVPLYASPTLIDFDFWSDNDFWESIIFQATFEEITLLPNVSKAQLKQIYLMRQKNIIFSTLTTYSHYMVMIGCELQQVKDIAGRFCHIYNLYDEHQRDLSKMIRTSTEKLNRLTRELRDQAIKKQLESQNTTKVQFQVMTQKQQKEFLQVETMQAQTQLKEKIVLEQKKDEAKQEISTGQNVSIEKHLEVVNIEKSS